MNSTKSPYQFTAINCLNFLFSKKVFKYFYRYNIFFNFKYWKGKKISEFNILDTWVVRQFANEYNPIHFHSGHLSGAGFLKLPNNFGKTTQDGKINQNGSLTLVHGSKQFLSSSMYAITPKVGDFYLFPHYLMHMVYPFYGNNEERRSISFNAKIDENIFDVYKQ